MSILTFKFFFPSESIYLDIHKTWSILKPDEKNYKSATEFVLMNISRGWNGFVLSR